MSPDRKSRIAPVQATPPKGKRMPPSSGIRWRGWAIVLGALCVLAGPGHAYSAGPVSSGSTPSFSPTFNFDEFTKNKPFTLNTLPTTRYGPPWADILLGPENFLACKGASIALCYYSGPANSVTPCTSDGEGVANCTCYAIPHGSTYYVDINAILNLDVYLDTVSACEHDGRGCQPAGTRTAPVCDVINGNKLIPGADLISTFSAFLDQEIPIRPTSCDAPALYAGCMTAPCKRTVDPVTGLPPVDPATGLELVQCACPTYTGPYQVGNLEGNQCVLGGDNVWSAAYTVPPQPPTPQPPPPHDCWPDAPGDSGCPLLPPNYLPPVPPIVSCKEVCSEYKKSNQKGVEIGFTCDATLCTAKVRDFDLVAEACDGLGKSSVSEILKLETAVGYSCSASQICGCEPNKKTNEAVYNLNKAQRERGIPPQCEQNGTLCGAQP
jgi:hypothetical protein